MLPSTDDGDSDIDSKEPKTFVKLRLNRTVSIRHYRCTVVATESCQRQLFFLTMTRCWAMAAACRPEREEWRLAGRLMTHRSSSQQETLSSCPVAAPAGRRSPSTDPGRR